MISNKLDWKKEVFKRAEFSTAYQTATTKTAKHESMMISKCVNLHTCIFTHGY